MEEHTKQLLTEIKEGRVLDIKVLNVDGSKYDIEDRQQRKTSLFTSRFDQSLEADHCYRVQWLNDNMISVVKSLGAIEGQDINEEKSEEDSIPF